MIHSRSILLVSVAALASIVGWACSENPSIDGQNVPKIGGLAPPSCEDACSRLQGLCGYPPVDCVALCSSAEEGYDDAHRICIGQASSCREALESCENEEPDGGEAELPDGAVGDAADSDATTDAPVDPDAG